MQQSALPAALQTVRGGMSRRLLGGQRVFLSSSSSSVCSASTQQCATSNKVVATAPRLQFPSFFAISHAIDVSTAGVARKGSCAPVTPRRFAEATLPSSVGALASALPLNRLALRSTSAFSSAVGATQTTIPRMSRSIVTVTFVEPSGEEIAVQCEPDTENLLTLAIKHKIDIEGACDGQVACSTCHVIFPQAYYDKLPPAKEDEVDMLDTAFGQTPTSRLGCQCKVTQDFDGVRLVIPGALSAPPAGKK